MNTKHLYTFLLLCCTTYAQATTWYVKTGSFGGATSWADANGDLQAVINIAAWGDDIYIAAGTYIPNRRADSTNIVTLSNRNNAFVLKNGLSLYGGFPAVGNPIFTDRDPTIYPTVLTGDFNSDDVVTGTGSTLFITGNSENAYHVMILAGNDSTTKVDGLSVSGGNANDESSSIIVSGLTFYGNNGGGMVSNNAAPRVNNCIFSANRAGFGGGMFNTNNASLPISNSRFSNNYAYDGLGGGIANQNAVIRLINCFFTGNFSQEYGGGICNVLSSFQAMSCQFSDNAATAGGGIYSESTTPYSISGTDFLNNKAYYTGGGIHNRFCSGAVINSCSFIGNSTQVNSGGGIYNIYSSVGINHSIFSGNIGVNQSGDGGGAISSDETTVNINNCSFSGNNVSNQLSTTTINNSILWNSTTPVFNVNNGSNIMVSYSIVQGGYAGAGNLGIDPLFFNAASPAGADGLYRTADDGLTLTGCSLALNSGINDSIPPGTTTDIIGNPVIYNSGIVDRGAYEYQGPISTDPILYVDSAVAISGTGTSWATAFKTLQEALSLVQSCGSRQIWVKKGTYYPTAFPANSIGGTGSRNYAFLMRNNLAIYGGFPVTVNPTFTDRNAAINPTILSGDFNNDDVVTGSGSTLSITGNSENAFHVVLSIFNDGTALIDGFTIKGGNANDPGTITLAGQPLNNQDGGGMYNFHFSSPVIRNCIFSANHALNYGGGMFNFNTTPAISSCSFAVNKATNLGGGMLNYIASSTITNCLFSGNNGGNGGGAMENADATPIVSNCSFSGNHAAEGGAMFNYNSPVIINNSILWGNTAATDPCIFNSSSIPVVSYSSVQGGYTGTGNLNTDPLFHNAINPSGNDGIYGTTDDGLTLQSGSPAINSGDNSLLPGGIATDIAGNYRIQSTIDRGAFESSIILPVTLLDFTAQPDGNDVVLSWVTTSEINSDRFELYYSVNGSYFNKAGQVIAGGYSYEPRHYSFVHNNATAMRIPVLYYKFKQIDKDGTFYYSKVVTVHLPEATGAILFYPNPITKGAMLTVAGRDITQVALYNIYGQKVWVRNYDRQQTVHVPMQQLVASTYLIQVNGATAGKLQVQPD